MGTKWDPIKSSHQRYYQWQNNLIDCQKELDQNEKCPLTLPKAAKEEEIEDGVVIARGGGTCPTETEEQAQWQNAANRIKQWGETLAECQSFLYHLMADVGIIGNRAGLDNPHCRNEYSSNELNGLDDWNWT